MGNLRPDSPYRRTYDDGRVVWIARYTNPVTGKREYAKPDWNRRKSTFELKRDAQRAINEAIDQARRGVGRDRADTVGGYLPRWLSMHPRGERTNDTNRHRIERLLDVEIDGKPLRNHYLSEVRRRHVNELVDYMLSQEGRSATGARNILRAFSAMFTDAIKDELTTTNPFLGASPRANDPRIRKRPKKRRVYTFRQMHLFAAAAGALRGPQAETMVRVLSDCGLRLGEMLALERAQFTGARLEVTGTAHDGRLIVVEGDTKRHRRTVPVPPSLADKLAVLVEHSDHPLLFPTLRGKVWRESNFYRDVWNPAREASGLDMSPHDMRHSWTSQLQAAGVDPADLAEIAGHDLSTLIGHYTHPLKRSEGRIKEVVEHG